MSERQSRSWVPQDLTTVASILFARRVELEGPSLLILASNFLPKDVRRCRGFSLRLVLVPPSAATVEPRGGGPTQIISPLATPWFKVSSFCKTEALANGCIRNREPSELDDSIGGK